MGQGVEQRRDHRVSVAYDEQERQHYCAVCFDPIREVHDRTLPVRSRHYWRHLRRWHRRDRG